MMRRHAVLVAAPLLGIAALLVGGIAQADPKTVRFADTRLKIEVNATDGDAGLQVFLDGEAWRAVQIYNPSREKILDVAATGPLENHGLTELFSESSEPPFDEFPLEQFKALFPEGTYQFRGTTVDGRMLVGQAELTHAIPEGPQILRPEDGERVPVDEVVVEWQPVAAPGVNIVGYQVLVTDEDPLRVFSADLPATARTLPIPVEFLEGNTVYKVEVLAIEEGGNQTLTEISFRTQ